MVKLLYAVICNEELGGKNKNIKTTVLYFLN